MNLDYANYNSSNFGTTCRPSYDADEKVTPKNLLSSSKIIIITISQEKIRGNNGKLSQVKN